MLSLLSGLWCSQAELGCPHTWLASWGRNRRGLSRPCLRPWKSQYQDRCPTAAIFHNRAILILLEFYATSGWSREQPTFLYSAPWASWILPWRSSLRCSWPSWSKTDVSAVFTPICASRALPCSAKPKPIRAYSWNSQVQSASARLCHSDISPMSESQFFLFSFALVQHWNFSDLEIHYLSGGHERQTSS